jgi:DNA-binding CsgD family transcriptional regulator
MTLYRLRPSEQELRVIRAVIVHGTIRGAARALGLSPHTVDSHLDHVRSKSGMRRFSQIVAWVSENGWLSVEKPARVE